MSTAWMKVMFVIAGVYDAALGFLFLVAGTAIYRYAGVTPPNHIGYVQFPALLLITFGIMFLEIAKDTIKHRDLILYGVALKASYCGVIFWHELHGGIPMLFLPWAWADLAFLVLFLIAWRHTAPTT